MTRSKPTLAPPDADAGADPFARALERIYSEIGFADPRGANRREVERALRETASAVAAYLGEVGSRSVAGEPVPDFSEPAPERAQPFSDLLRETFERVVHASIHLSHPRYMAHMDSGVAFAGIAGDLVASALNQNLLARELAPAATAVEGQVVRWFCDAANLPRGSGGTFVGGGTMANLTALLAARDRAFPEASEKGLRGLPPLRLFASSESHYSVRKSAAVLGLGAEAVVPVPADSAFRMDPEALRRSLAEERTKGNFPLALVATAGTTSTGSIDPLLECASIAREERLWFHVDASHGGALLFSPRERSKLAGIESADSIAFDPHKWLWAPKSAGVVLLRDFASFRPASYQAPYIDREEGNDGLGRKAIEGSRPFDALKVWMIFRHLGTRRIAAVLERNLLLARFLAAELRRGGVFRPLHEPEMNVLCFASEGDGRRELEAYRRLLRSGEGWISTTKLGGKRALRTVILNPSTTPEDLRRIARNLEDAP